jgi:hypothetical protein
MLVVYFAALVLIYAGVYYRSCRAGADCKDATIATVLAIFLGIVSIVLVFHSSTQSVLSSSPKASIKRIC